VPFSVGYRYRYCIESVVICTVQRRLPLPLLYRISRHLHRSASVTATVTVSNHSRRRLSTVAASLSSRLGEASTELILAASGLLAGLPNGVPYSPSPPPSLDAEPPSPPTPPKRFGVVETALAFRWLASRASFSLSNCLRVEMRAFLSFRSPLTSASFCSRPASAASTRARSSFSPFSTAYRGYRLRVRNRFFQCVADRANLLWEASPPWVLGLALNISPRLLFRV
jgi:hypothetical protein